MKNIRLIWFGLAILVVLLCLYATPIALLVEYEIFLSIFGGFLAGFFIFLGICNITSFKELIDKNNPKTNSTATIMVSVFSAFLLGILMIFLFIKRVDNQLIKDGQFAKAIITGGSAETRKSRRSEITTYKVGVEFKDTIRNKEHYISTEVTEEVFNSLYEGQEVEIKFLPDNPSVLKLIVGDENVRKFKNIENRKLNIKDIERIVFSEDIENEIDYLNSISQGWEKVKNENGIIFSNDLKEEALAISFDEKIIFKNSQIHLFVYENHLKESSKPFEDLINQEDVVVQELYETEKLYIGVIQFVVDSILQEKESLFIRKK